MLTVKTKIKRGYRGLRQDVERAAPSSELHKKAEDRIIYNGEHQNLRDIRHTANEGLREELCPTLPDWRSY